MIRAALLRTRFLLAFALLLCAVFAYNALFSFSYSVGPNYRNVSIDTRVNITNAAPELLAVRLPTSVTLNAGATTYVECNVSVMDYNGAGDLNYTNATFFHNATSSHGAADNNNSHYTNGTCTLANQDGNYANYTCGFFVRYYALNGTWVCNATVIDNRSYTDTGHNTTSIAQVLALNVTPLIDYGNLSVGDTSANKTANVTNIGNAAINVSVKGYGLAQNDGLAFVCSSGNITIGNERYSANPSVDWASKTPLTGSFQNITGLTVARQNDSNLRTNTTYWQLYVPPNPFGECNGTVVFQAELA